LAPFVGFWRFGFGETGPPGFRVASTPSDDAAGGFVARDCFARFRVPGFAALRGCPMASASSGVDVRVVGSLPTLTPRAASGTRGWSSAPVAGASCSSPPPAAGSAGSGSALSNLPVRGCS
jgi:hypothetical protein